MNRDELLFKKLRENKLLDKTVWQLLSPLGLEVIGKTEYRIIFQIYLSKKTP